MTVRPYAESDWPAVRNIDDLAKPDEMRGSIADLSAILPLEEDARHLALFRESNVTVLEESGTVAERRLNQIGRRTATGADGASEKDKKAPRLSCGR